MERVIPEVPEALQTIPEATLVEVRELFERPDVFVFTTVGGSGGGHTPDREVAERLTRKGWLLGTETDGDGVEREVRLICYQDGIFEMAKGGRTFYSFRIPAALVGLVREMHDAA